MYNTIFASIILYSILYTSKKVAFRKEHLLFSDTEVTFLLQEIRKY